MPYFNIGLMLGAICTLIFLVIPFIGPLRRFWLMKGLKDTAFYFYLAELEGLNEKEFYENRSNYSNEEYDAWDPAQFALGYIVWILGSAAIYLIAFIGWGVILFFGVLVLLFKILKTNKKNEKV